MEEEEEKIFNLIKEKNRPFNVMEIHNFMAQYKISKNKVQQVVEKLDAEGKITSKEYGKSKIYYATQSNFTIKSDEEIKNDKAEIEELKLILENEIKDNKKLEKELSMLKTSLSIEEMEQRIDNINKKNELLENQLIEMNEEGSPIEIIENKSEIEKNLAENLRIWQKWKKVFKNIWDIISENFEKSQKELFEEIGIEKDEDHNVNINDLRHLITKKQK